MKNNELCKRFSEVKVGEWFDFISPTSHLNSFYERCTKASARTYIDTKGRRYRVGTARVHVYHVSDKPEVQS